MLNLFRILVCLFFVNVVNTAATADEPAETAPSGGELLWSLQMGAPLWGDLLVHEDTVYVGSDDGHLYAVSISNRALRWKFATKGPVRSAPALDAGALYFTSDDGQLYKLNAATGEQVWSFDLQDSKVQRSLPGPVESAFDWSKSSPVLVDGIVYVGSADGAIYAVDANGKQLHWRVQTEGAIRGSALIDGGRVYVGNWAGKLYAVDRTNGQIVWQRHLQGAITSTPALVNGVLTIGSRGAQLFGLKPSTGEIVWQRPAANGSWVESTASSNLDGQTFFIGSSDGRHLLSMASDTGEIQWEFHTGGWSWATPRVHGDAVYIGALGVAEHWQPVERGLFAVDAATGKLRWQYKPAAVEGYINGGFVSKPAVVGETLLAASVDGRLYAFAR